MALFKKDRILKALNLGLVLLFILLIFKDPFSKRTLIPNFEPYPDAFHYINPALSLAKGEGFRITREGREIQSSVPPLYSLSLVPAFVIKSDPRASYYANVFLALISLFLFWIILKRIFNNKLIVYLLLILYVTNYFIYWVPSLIMAENLTLLLYLAALFFLLSKTTKLNTLIVAAFAIGSYATKYANIPITLSIAFLYIMKVSFSDLSGKQKAYSTLSFLGIVVVFLLILVGFEQATKGNNIFSQIFGNISLLYNSVPKGETQSKTAVASSWFGIQYIEHNLPLYIKSLLGQHNRFLWDNTPLVPGFVGIGAFFGIFSMLFSKKFRFISISLLLFIATSVGFMSTFYSFDARYVYIVIPSLLIGFGLFLNRITEKRRLFDLLIIILLCVYLISSFVRIKSQISLNLRYAETPWYYISVLKLNEYFTKDKIIDGKKPVVISAVPPFLVDYYSNGNYKLLPLSYDQEFRSIKEIVWGPNDYSNLPKLYKKYLHEGYEVFVSRAGLGNEGYTNRDFNTIVEEFDTKLVQPGCYDQCNIYSVKLKEKNGQ